MLTHEVQVKVLRSLEGGTLTREGEDHSKVDGYWVGGAGSTLVFNSEQLIMLALVNEFFESCLSEYVGWWTDSETGKVYFDAVTWFPDLRAAHRAAEDRGEIAFWDIANGEEVRTS